MTPYLPYLICNLWRQRKYKKLCIVSFEEITQYVIKKYIQIYFIQ